jgi:cytidylate kinase
MSSVVSTIRGVRRAMVERQRLMGQRGAVLNGRDIGTVVFPDADIKFFLTASPEERAERRFNEDRVTNASVSFQQTLTEMTERDRRDSTRADSPLKVADDAIVIDSSALSIEQVFARMMEYVHRHH